MSNNATTPKYVINPEAEILGAALQALVESQNLYDFHDLVEQFGFDNIQPDQWYSWEDGMAFLKALTTRHNQTSNLVSIGIKVFDVLPLPENVQTIADGLQMMNMMAEQTQRHVNSDLTWYQVEQADDNCIKFVDHSPIPHDLIYGEVYSLARRLSPANMHFVVRREYCNEASPDLDGAVYHIELSPK